MLRQVRGLPQLFRVKPVVSWGAAALLLGLAVAINRAGVGLNWTDGLIAALGVLLAQGIVSHGFNDAYDWLTGTDKESIGKGTGGSRVIPEGKMSVVGVTSAAALSLAGVVAIGVYFYTIHGLPILVLLAIAVWSPVAYSLPPLKLGYRPFNELVVVLPALVGVVVGTDLVLTGSWSWLAVAAGTVHALFCISWFIVSRVPDYEPDKRVGKVTSVVWVGRDNAALLSAAYLALGLAVASASMVVFTPAFFVGWFGWAVMTANLSLLDAYDPEVASDIRLQNMHLTSLHALMLAGLLIGAGVA